MLFESNPKFQSTLVFSQSLPDCIRSVVCLPSHCTAMLPLIDPTIFFTLLARVHHLTPPPTPAPLLFSKGLLHPAASPCRSPEQKDCTRLLQQSPGFRHGAFPTGHGQ